MFVHNINPILIEAFGFKIYYYGAMYALLFLSSYFIARWYLKKYNKNPDIADNILLVCVLAVIIGARLGHVFFYSWPYFSQHPMEILYVWRGGLASHGATIALILAVWLLTKLTKIRFWVLADLVALCAPIGVILVRIGNFINGEIVGRMTDVSWSVVFPCNRMVRGECGNEPRHPVQLYESFSGIVIFLLLLWVFKKRGTKQPGLISGLFMISYFGARFFIEFFKEYDGTILIPPLTNGQTLSIPLVIFGIWIIWDSYKKSKSAKK